MISIQDNKKLLIKCFVDGKLSFDTYQTCEGKRTYESCPRQLSNSRQLSRS